MDNQGGITVGAILAKLSSEERALILSEQKSALNKASLQAKKKHIQRTMDKVDRRRVTECLTTAGYEGKKITLNDIRTLALRWVLDNHSNIFGLYIKQLHCGAKSSGASRHLTQLSHQFIQQVDYKSPAEHDNE